MKIHLLYCKAVVILIFLTTGLYAQEKFIAGSITTIKYAKTNTYLAFNPI